MSSDASERGSLPEAEQPRRTRRSLLQLLGALAVGAVGGAAAGTGRAEATDGAALTVGTSNTSTAKTTLLATAAPTDDGAFVVEAQTAGWALEGSGPQVGVLGSGFIGVTGTGDVGGFFSGSVAAISLQPQEATGAPTGGEYHRGDILVDATGVMYLCIADGTPGTWIRISHNGTNLLPTPQRAYDSRAVGGKLRPGAGDVNNPRVIQITGVTQGVPAEARGIVGNITVTQEDAGGFATIWPTGPAPQTSSVNFNAGVDTANAFTVGLGPGGNVSVAAFGGPTHVIIDVAGYIL